MRFLWPAAVPSGLTQVGASFLLLFTMWPFHHKKPAALPDDKTGYQLYGDWPPDQNVGGTGKSDGSSGEGFELFRYDDCTKQDDLYFYVAEDNTISFSHAGCEAAKTNVEAARTFNQFGSRKI